MVPLVQISCRVTKLCGKAPLGEDFKKIKTRLPTSLPVERLIGLLVPEQEAQILKGDPKFLTLY